MFISILFAVMSVFCTRKSNVGWPWSTMMIIWFIIVVKSHLSFPRHVQYVRRATVSTSSDHPSIAFTGFLSDLPLGESKSSIAIVENRYDTTSPNKCASETLAKNTMVGTITKAKSHRDEEGNHTVDRHLSSGNARLKNSRLRFENSELILIIDRMNRVKHGSWPPTTDNNDDVFYCALLISRNENREKSIER